MMRPITALSWSGMSLLERSEKEYIKRYFYGEKFENKEMRFGKKLAEALKENKTTGDDVIDFMILQIPKLDLMDEKFETKIKTHKDMIPIIGYIDTVSMQLTAIKEYKTGKGEWTQNKVDNHGQITFYCVLLEAITSKPVTDIELIWLPTREDNGQIEFTGNIKTFKTTRGTAEKLKMKVRISQAWQKIGELYNQVLI